MKYGLLLLSLIMCSSTLPKMSLDTLAKKFETMSQEEFTKEVEGRRTAAEAFATKKILELHQLKRLPQLLNYAAVAITGVGITLGGFSALAVGIYGALADYALLSKKPDMKGLEQLGYLIFGCIGGLGLIAVIAGGITCVIGFDKIQNYLSIQAFEEMKLAQITHYENFLQRINESQ